MTIINPNILVQPGARFGRLVVVKLAPPVKDRRQEVYCDCDCGSRMVLLRANNVRAGMTQSCGCLPEKGRAHTTAVVRVPCQRKVERTQPQTR
jgi:hypothetical protein